MTVPLFDIQLPDWCDEYTQHIGNVYPEASAQMELVLKIVDQNIDHGGGPFGAAVFDQNSKLISIGMNLVTASNCSLLHAEIVALVLAEKSQHSYDLSNHGKQHFTLVTSCEPCTMCLGATIWSGIDHIICAARDEDARTIGFDEGPKPADVNKELKKRNIRITRDIYRDKAILLMQKYCDSGKPIYNPRQKPT